MMKNSIFKTIALGAAISLVGFGCGGDSSSGPGVTTYGGLTTDATLTANNAEQIMTAGSESALQSVDTGDANNNFTSPLAVASGSSSNVGELIYNATKQVAANAQANNLPVGITITADQLNQQTPGAYCGGSITFPDTFGQNGMNGTITYSGFCIVTPDGNLTINGTVTYAETATEISISYTNVTISFMGQTHTLNSTMTCDLTFTTCAFSSDYTGTDGKTYRVANVTITGDDISGWNVSADFYHPDYGRVTLTTTAPLLFNCTNGHPSQGSLTINSSDGGSASITYTSCAGYDFSYTLADASTGSGSGVW